MLAETIADLRVRAKKDLDLAWDYYNHTLVAWESLGKFVAEGREIAVSNLDTGSVTTGPELAALAQEYTSGYLAEAVFQKFVAVFEDWTFGVIGAWLTAYPRSLAGPDSEERVDKTIPIEVILDSPDRDTILRVIVDRELDRIKYRRLAAWFVYLNKRAKLDVPTANQVGLLAEIKAARDILTHNAGIINRTYRDKAASWARYEDGERVEISEPYLRASWVLISEVIAAVSEAVIAKRADRATSPPTSEN